MSKPWIAVLIELVGGYFGLLGIGWMYVGDVLRGILILVGYFILFWVGGWLTFFSFGLLSLVFVPLYIAAPIVSAIFVYQFARDKWL